MNIAIKAGKLVAETITGEKFFKIENVSSEGNFLLDLSVYIMEAYYLRTIDEIRELHTTYGETLRFRDSFYNLSRLSENYDSILKSLEIPILGYTSFKEGGGYVRTKLVPLQHDRLTISELGCIGHQAKKDRESNLFRNSNTPKKIESIKKALSLGLISVDEMRGRLGLFILPHEAKNLHEAGLISDEIKKLHKVLLTPETPQKIIRELVDLNFNFDEKSETYQKFIVEKTLGKLG